MRSVLQNIDPNRLSTRAWAIWYFLMAMGLTLGPSVGRLVFKGSASVGPWKQIPHHVNYQEYGFVKRGLPGTVMRLLGVEPTETSVMAVSLVLLTVCCAAITLLLASLREKVEQSYFHVASIVILLSPAAFMQLGYGAGRYDVILIACFVVSVPLAMRGRASWVGILAVPAILTHEIYALFFLPSLAMLAWTYASGQREKWTQLVLACAPAVVVGIVITLFGMYEPGLDAILAKLTASPTIAGYEATYGEDGLRPIAAIWASDLALNAIDAW